MPGLPDDVAAALARGIGTYIRELPPHELPPKLRRFRSFRPQALIPHRDTLLESLDDDATRARIGHWLEKEKPPLSKSDARLLAVATARGDGWEDELKSSAQPAPASRTRAEPRGDSKITAERDKTRRAKDDLKKVRDEARALEQRDKARIAELEALVAELQGRLEVAREEADASRKEAAAVVDRADRMQRKARGSIEKAHAERDAARKEAKELRKELNALRRNAHTAPALPPVPGPAKKASNAPKKRRQLRVPKGRLEDDPATLEGWLARDDVRLLIDGYNVAKADGGYEDLQLDSQRERLVADLYTLARMTDTETIVVFDAQRVPGRRSRKTKRPVVIEWSNAGQIADDYIITRLEELPEEPVVLVTNDKELQERGRALAATIATSQQLLALIR